MRLTKDILQIQAYSIGFALVCGVISLATAVGCEELGLVRYPSSWESVRAWFGTLLLGATAGGLFGFVCSVKRCGRLVPVCNVVREADDDVW